MPMEEKATEIIIGDWKGSWVLDLLLKTPTNKEHGPRGELANE